MGSFFCENLVDFNEAHVHKTSSYTYMSMLVTLLYSVKAPSVDTMSMLVTLLNSIKAASVDTMSMLVTLLNGIIAASIDTMSMLVTLLNGIIAASIDTMSVLVIQKWEISYKPEKSAIYTILPSPRFELGSISYSSQL